MLPPPHLFKFGRAFHHLETLRSEIKAWLGGNHYTVTTKADSQHPGYYVVVASADPIQLDPFAILIGDILQNIRSGLDHIAYRLAENFTNPLPRNWSESSEFPIFGDVDGNGNTGAGPRLFQEYGRRKIRGVDPGAQAIIETLQPYHRGQAFTADPLWKLHELSRIDKHRLLHLAIAQCVTPVLRLGFFPFENVRFPAGSFYIHVGPIEKDTVVARFPAQPIDPELAMYVNFKPIVSVAFPQGGIAGGEDVLETLIEIYNHIVNNVDPPLYPYL